MSNNFQNLFIILALAGIILYISNLRQKRYENFSVLNKLISGIDNMTEAELEEYEKKIAEDNEEEKLIDDLNKASKLIGEDEDDEILNEELIKQEVVPIEEEENNFAMIEEEMNEEEFKRKLASGKINSNITGEKLEGESNIFSENIAEKQLEEEEEFRKFLGGEMKNLPESEEEEMRVMPFAEEENAFNLAEEEMVQEEIRQRLIHQEEEEMSRKRAAERLQESPLQGKIGSAIEESILDEQYLKNILAQEELNLEEERLNDMARRQRQFGEEMMLEEERLNKLSKSISANQEYLQQEELIEEERLNHMRARQRIIDEEEEENEMRRRAFLKERNGVSMEEEYRNLQEEIGEEQEYAEERDRYLAEEAKKINYMEEEERYRLSEEEGEIMSQEAKQEMKNRMKYQVNCGTFIDPKYKKRIEGCGTKAYMKLKKPFNQKLKEIMHNRDPNMPKPIKQVYDELTTQELNKDADTLCQHVQKGMSMGSCSRSYEIIGEEDEGITDTLRANDSCFDPYSNY